MLKSGPLVSFCVPTYQRAAFLDQTLTSALAQTVSDIEIVVVDDCSPDNTVDVVNSFRDTRIRYFRNKENLGVPENLNRAMSIAKGTYLVLLEDHDLLEPTYLEEAVKVMHRYKSVGFVATGLITIDERGNSRELCVEDLPEFMFGRKLLRRLLTRTVCPFPVTTVIRRSAIEGIEPLFDPRYGWYADQYLWLRLSAKSDFGYVAKPLMKFRMRETDHYLTDRHWESYLCLDRIHRDNWWLLYPRLGLRSRRDWLLYEKSKLWRMAIFRTSRILRNERWIEEDDRLCKSYLSPLSRLILKFIGMLPIGLIYQLRDAYRFYHYNRTKFGKGTAKTAKEVERA